MKSTVDLCPACGGPAAQTASGTYRRCGACGHESLSCAPGAVEMVNDRLEAGGLDRKNALDRFKSSVLRRSARSRDLLLDIGSASGRFLLQNAAGFSRTLGVEVSAECLRFSRALGLHVETDLAALRGPVSVATFWHSLEHLPAETIAAVLTTIRSCSTDETVVIVSVPNAASFQSALFKERFAFYDPPHHRHQFTPRSLDRLLARFGFARVRGFGSFAYAAFGWLQGLLNLFNSRHDYLYYRTKRGWDYGLSPARRSLLDAYNLALSLLLLAPSLALGLLDLLLPLRGGVITSCYRPETPSR